MSLYFLVVDMRNKDDVQTFAIRSILHEFTHSFLSPTKFHRPYDVISPSKVVLSIQNAELSSPGEKVGKNTRTAEADFFTDRLSQRNLTIANERTYTEVPYLYMK